MIKYKGKKLMNYVKKGFEMKKAIFLWQSREFFLKIGIQGLEMNLFKKWRLAQTENVERKFPRTSIRLIIHKKIEEGSINHFL